MTGVCFHFRYNVQTSSIYSPGVYNQTALKKYTCQIYLGLRKLQNSRSGTATAYEIFVNSINRNSKYHVCPSETLNELNLIIDSGRVGAITRKMVT